MNLEKKAILRRFVVFEGGDGAGTTTQLKLLGAALDSAGVSHWTTSEPTDRPEGLLIRRVLSGELDRDPGTLARLYAADRNEHLYGKLGILERLGRGEVVVCDRYTFSSLAYQGITCGPELPARLNEAFPLPELLVFFDIPPAQSMDRLGSRERLDIFEELGFQEKVRAAYREAIDRYSSCGMRIATVDASQSVAEVSAAILGAVGEALGLSLAADTK